MKNRVLTFAGIVAGSLVLVGSTVPMPIPQACAQQATMSYSEDIVPIFRGWCVSCHQPGGEGYEASGFDLTTYEGLMQGTNFGPMVIPGDPDVSNLVHLIEGRASPELSMPHGQKRLPNCLRRNIWTWVFEGAKDN